MIDQLFKEFERFSSTSPMITSSDRSLYYFLVTYWNDHGQENPFKIKNEESLIGSKISNRRYLKTSFENLHKSGFIKFTAGKNKHTLPIVRVLISTGRNENYEKDDKNIFLRELISTGRSKNGTQLPDNHSEVIESLRVLISTRSSENKRKNAEKVMNNALKNDLRVLISTGRSKKAVLPELISTGRAFEKFDFFSLHLFNIISSIDYIHTVYNPDSIYSNIKKRKEKEKKNENQLTIQKIQFPENIQKDFDELQKELEQHSNVLKMGDQLTIEDYFKLRTKYNFTKASVSEILESMNNSKAINKLSSVFQTAKNWLNKSSRYKLSEEQLKPFKSLYNEFHIDKTSGKAIWTKTNEEFLSKIVLYLKDNSINKDLSGAEKSLKYILKNWGKVEPYYAKQIKLAEIFSNLSPIMLGIKTGNSGKNKGTNGANGKFEERSKRRNIEI